MLTDVTLRMALALSTPGHQAHRLASAHKVTPRVTVVVNLGQLDSSRPPVWPIAQEFAKER